MTERPPKSSASPESTASSAPALLPDGAALDACRRCELWRHATQGVPGTGPARARIVIVGEQPGDQEDRQGHPFVGPAGRILDAALAQAGIARNEVYVTNAVKHFKWEARGKRRMHKTPAQREIEACHYWLESELGGLRAKAVVVLGSTALKSVLETGSATLGKVMGEVLEHEGRAIVPTFHPSYVLRLRDEADKAAAMAAIVAALRTAADIAGKK